MNDWDDRIVDAALQELHGQQPPDLSARVLLALREAPAGPLPLLRESPPRGRAPWPWRSLAALLFAALCLGSAGALLVRKCCWSSSVADASAPQLAVLDVQVHAGEVECVEVGTGTPTQVVPAGASSSFVVRAGSRLRCARASAFQLGPFGMLAGSRQTELEVVDMKFDRKQGIVAASLTLAVVAGSVTWQVLSRTDTAVAGETVRLEAAASGTGVAAASADVEQLRRRIAELERQNQALQDQVHGREVAVASTVAPTPVEPPPPVVAGPMFDDPRFAAALAKIDWAAIGDVTKEMVPLVAQLVAAMSKDGAEMPMDLVIKIHQLNGKLIAQLPAMIEAGVPGYGENGIYTHPLMAANTLASTLASAGMALTPAQQQAIGGLVRAFSNESQAIAGASREFAVEQLLEEVEMKDRFYREVGGLLAPDQQGAIQPEGVGGYDGGSHFSAGLVTQAYALAVPAKDAADFARGASSRLADQLGLDEATTAQVRTVLAQVASASELWRDRGDPRETQLHMLRSGRTTAALRNQLQWMRQIQQQVNLTPEQKKKLASMKNVLVPLPR